MHDGMTLSVVIVVVELLFVASMVAIVSRKYKFPFTVALVVLGLLLGWASKGVPLLETLSAFRLTPDVVMFVFLPVLLFQAAFNLDARSLIKNMAAIYMLAVPALLISVATAGFLVHHFLGLPIWVALLFGALISATDPVAVVALFKDMGAPKRLHLLVEGESLFNDGTALVVFKVILGIVLAGTISGATVAQGMVDFVIIAMGGTVVGIALGAVFSLIIGRVSNNPLVEITLSTILAHSSFIIAEHLLHVSGVISTVMAAIVLGSYGRSKISPQVLGNMESFWEYFAFVCNSLIFLLVGLSIDFPLFVDNLHAILLGSLAVLLARALAVYTVFAGVRLLRFVEGVSIAFQTVIFWGGLRGALAIVMVLSIPESLPQRSFLLVLTLGIVLTTLLVNGLTLKPLLSLLGLDRYTLKERLERSQAMFEAKQRAKGRIIPFAGVEGIDTHLALDKVAAYQGEADAIAEELEHLRKQVRAGDESEVVLRHCLFLEKSHYQSRFSDGMISEMALKDLLLDIDRQLDRLKEGRDVCVYTPVTGYGMMMEAAADAPVLGSLIKRALLRRLELRYEAERVRLAVCTIVLKELNNMIKRNMILPGVALKADEMYNGMRDRAVARMEAIWRKHPDIAEEVERRILDRLCLKSEMDSYSLLYWQGAITEKIRIEMEESIARRLKAL